MSEFTKPTLVSAIATLLSLGKTSEKDLANLSKETLDEIYENYVTNARYANNAHYKPIIAANRANTAT